MSVTVYMFQMPEIFDNAHKSIWESRNTGSLSVDEQIKYWWEDHKGRVFGGPYDPNWSPSKIQTPIGVTFETKEDYVLFMMKWS